MSVEYILYFGIFPNSTILIIFSPVILQRNWEREAEKFFSPDRLPVNKWTPDAWASNHQPDTVWIVKVIWLRDHSDFMNTVNSPEFQRDIEIASSWSDEYHLFSRANQSQ